MDAVEENTKTKHTWKVLFYRLLLQVGWVFLCGTLAVSCWLGYLGWSQIQMTNPPNPENIIVYAAGAMFGITVCIGHLTALLTWGYAVNRTDADRNYAKLFLHFQQKYFNNVVPFSDECKNQTELMDEVRRAGVDTTDINIERARELDYTMRILRQSDIDQQFIDLAGFVGTMRRQNLRYCEELELAQENQVKQRQLLDDLAAVKKETDRLAVAASELQTEHRTGVVRLKQPTAE
jgi:hypothetical protein